LNVSRCQFQQNLGKMVFDEPHVLFSSYFFKVSHTCLVMVLFANLKLIEKMPSNQ
jgi:hypothetical protein